MPKFHNPKIPDSLREINGLAVSAILSELDSMSGHPDRQFEYSDKSLEVRRGSLQCLTDRLANWKDNINSQTNFLLIQTDKLGS